MTDYWEDRYSKGGTSGPGSRGDDAVLKARLVNEAVAVHRITSLLDVGSGDGYQASLFQLGACKYLGVDPSKTAVRKARKIAAPKAFQVLDGGLLPLSAHLSMDVLHHLTDTVAYQDHLRLLFAARRMVFVYGTNHDEQGNHWVLHREWTSDVPDGWRRVSEVGLANGKHFWVYERTDA